MAKLVALYKTPSNRSEFDAYYTATHAPLAKTMPGLQHYEISAGPVKAGGSGKNPYSSRMRSGSSAIVTKLVTNNANAPPAIGQLAVAMP